MAFGLNLRAINGICSAKSTQDTQSTKHTQSEQR